MSGDRATAPPFFVSDIMTSPTANVSTRPMIDPSTTRFWDRHAERYSQSPIADQASYERKLAMTREFMTTETNVLEFGCGTGSTALLHAPYVRTIDAIDISGKMIEIAQRKAEAEGIANVSFSRGTLDDYEAPNGSLDMVMGMSILHLLKDRQSAIRRAFDLLKPGGTFVSSTVCLAEGYSIFRFIGPIGMALGLLPTLRVFSAAQLVEDMKAAGFSIERQWRPGPRKAVFIVARKPE